MQTEFEFKLPKGYLDSEGTLHRDGVMRLATAADEIIPIRDPRVRNNTEYLPIVILSRVITRLGTLPAVTSEVLESLFVPDMKFLQSMYETINQADPLVFQVKCPNCGHSFDAPLRFSQDTDE